METPITERSNEFSLNIDLSSPIEIAEILFKCDQEIFTGWNGSQGIFNANTKEKIIRISEALSEVLQDSVSGTVVLSGCGTSGRLAFITAKTFNKVLENAKKRPRFQYIIAGNDRALFTSQELSEDDPHTGIRDLNKVTESFSRVLYIGITCGFSAPYIAGQLDFCLDHPEKYTPVLIGFNPVHLARNNVIENWDKTFLQVVERLTKAQETSKGYILNPIIGPEPITGSSRMKAGSATKILLEVISLCSFSTGGKQWLDTLLVLYKEVCEQVYKNSDKLGALMELASDCLLSGGHVYYLGSTSTALVAMIDASECPPTFGASLDDLRGFVADGYKSLANNEGDISHEGKHYRISLAHFKEEIAPYTNTNDLVIFLDEETLTSLEEEKGLIPAKKVFVTCSINDTETFQPKIEGEILPYVFKLDVKGLNEITPENLRLTLCRLLQEIGVKWIVNNLSTGAHVLKGKVMHNKMVDLRVSNQKLYYRAIGIVQEYSGMKRDECETILLKSIYCLDVLTQLQLDSSISNHIKAAANQEKVVPTAIIMSALKCSFDEAKAKLGTSKNLRKIISKN